MVSLKQIESKLKKIIFKGFISIKLKKYTLFYKMSTRCQNTFQLKNPYKIRDYFKLEGLVGFEPTLRELQSRALPLGYRPIFLFQ